MKKFNTLRMPLFDSSNANFKVNIEVQFTRGNQETGYRDLVYANDRFTGMLSPNIYITIAYKSDDATPIYTSYPQIHKIRRAFNAVLSVVESEDPWNSDPNVPGKAFIFDNDELKTSPLYETGVVINGIGKANNWIIVKPCVIQSGENGVIQRSPGVSIALSTSNGYVSVLSVDEFASVCEMFNDISLPTIQAMTSLAYLDTPGVQGGPVPLGSQAPYYPNQAPYSPRGSSGYYPQYQQQNRGYHNNYQPQNGNYQPRAYTPQNPQPQTMAHDQVRPSYRQAPAQHSEGYGTSMPQNRQTQSQQLPPRESKSNPSLMTLGNVEETEVEEISLNDQAAIDSIFSNDD